MIAYPVCASGEQIVFTDPVLEHMLQHRQTSPSDNEAGGQLFAGFNKDVIRIESATGPRRSDRRSVAGFVPNRRAERREIRRYHKAGLHYVGDWHTHPERVPGPSATDIASFQDMFRKSRHGLASFVMVILGTSPLPPGLFVALCDADRILHLTPSEGSIRPVQERENLTLGSRQHGLREIN